MTDRAPGPAARMARLIVAAAVLWHLVAVLAPPRVAPPPRSEGRDFASYYYAAEVALSGRDPYDKHALDAAAKEDGTRAQVHPFFYPPPFLWLVAWAPALPLTTAFRVWLVATDLALLAACLALVRWWRPLADSTVPVLAGVVALMYAVAYTIELGQANFPVLALICLGLWQERERPAAAGALVGLAAMMKMSPALIVAWWLLRRRWVAAGSAVAIAVVSSILTLPLLGFGEQARFYSGVLPRLGAGDYMGLTIQIDLFANHSIPNLLHQAFPSGENVLSATARALSSACTLALVGALGWLFRRPTRDPVALAAQACAVLVAMLLIPVYTYEHHLVFAIPAIVLSLVGVQRGWLSGRWVVPLGVAVAVLLYDQMAIRQYAQKMVGEGRPLFFALQELKFLALVTVGLAVTWLGQTAYTDPSRPPAPEPA